MKTPCPMTNNKFQCPWPFCAACSLTAPAQTPQDTNVIHIQRCHQAHPHFRHGFTGEADSVLKFDLSVLGLEPTAADKAAVSGQRHAKWPAGRALAARRPARAARFSPAFTAAALPAPRPTPSPTTSSRPSAAPPPFSTPESLSAAKWAANIELFVSDFDGHDAGADDPRRLPGRHAFLVAGRTGTCSTPPGKAATPRSSSTTPLTGQRSVLAGYGGGNYNPAVSPDGDKVAMILSKGGSPNLYVSDSSGGNLQATDPRARRGFLAHLVARRPRNLLRRPLRARRPAQDQRQRRTSATPCAPAARATSPRRTGLPTAKASFLPPAAAVSLYGSCPPRAARPCNWLLVKTRAGRPIPARSSSLGELITIRFCLCLTCRQNTSRMSARFREAVPSLLGQGERRLLINRFETMKTSSLVSLFFVGAALTLGLAGCAHKPGTGITPTPGRTEARRTPPVAGSATARPWPRNPD